MLPNSFFVRSIIIGAFAFLINSNAYSQNEVSIANSWEEAKKSKNAIIEIYWYESRPFIYKTRKGMEGIEFEIMEDFKTYLKEKHGIEITLVWKEAKSFANTYTIIRDTKRSGIFAVSAFSITAERKLEVDFSPPYIADISVLITSMDVPIVNTRDEFNRVFSNLTAITIEGTTYEHELLRLKNIEKVPFRIQYISSSENILRTVEELDNTFGFIDLPVYMMVFKNNPSINVKRQNLFPMKREGYAIIYPQGSDWGVPMRQFFADRDFKKELEKNIAKYIDVELYHFIENLALDSHDPLVLLTKEKEIQYNDLLGMSKQLEREARTRNYLIMLIVVILIFLIIIIILYLKRKEQNVRIETQRKNIEIQNQQLEKRNYHLLSLDEEKNNLIKVLAHDLRTPINHVQGLAQVFLSSNHELSDEQKHIIQTISDSATRLNRMITNILDIDAIEDGRLKLFMDEVRMDVLVSQVVKSFEKQASRKKISFTLACDHPCVVKADSLFLIQIFENLVSNAIKFSRPGKDVSVTVKPEGEKIKVLVKDNGPGLTEDDLKLMFKKFQRLSPRPTAGESSTGLGLSIVKKYVEVMGGQVTCESKVDEGTTFTVEFSKS
jgi:signal transduction histidine kinase